MHCKFVPRVERGVIACRGPPGFRKCTAIPLLSQRFFILTKRARQCRWLRWQVESKETLAALACLRFRLHEAFAHCCQRGFRNFPQHLQDAVEAAVEVFSQEGVTDQDQVRVRGRCALIYALSMDRHYDACPGYHVLL